MAEQKGTQGDLIDDTGEDLDSDSGVQELEEPGVQELGEVETITEPQLDNQ